MNAAVAQVTLYNDLALNEKTISNYISLASKEDVDLFVQSVVLRAMCAILVL